MAEIIPAILTDSFEDAQQKARSVASAASLVQLDVSDGVFTQKATWGEPERIAELGTDVEVHLMVQRPEEILPLWADSGAKRIYIHYEATQQHQECLSVIRGAGMEAGLALLPETSADVVAPLIDSVDALLIFSGSLGEYGGAFQQEPTLSKISTLRGAYPQLTIEVDGGMNPDTAKLVVGAGANAVVSGSFIFGGADPVAAIEELQRSL